MQSVVYWLWLLPVLALLAAGSRIIASGSSRTYPLLLSLIGVSVLTFVGGNAAYATLAPTTYARIWVAACVATWSLTALALTEACTRSLEPYEEFGRIGRRIIHVVLCFTGLVIGGWLLLAPAEWSTQFFQFFQNQAYLVQASLALLGMSVWVFLRWARLRLRSNSRLAMTAITVFCIGEAALGAGISAHWPSGAFYVGLSWTIACWGAIALLWSQRPDEAEAGPRRAYDQLAARSAMAELETTNSGLADIVRRG